MSHIPSIKGLLIGSTALLLAWPQSAFGQLDITGHIYAHDPSTIIKDRNTYYVFNTGDGIGVKSSGNLKDWDREEPVFSGSPEAWITSHVGEFEGHYWAPDVARINDIYYLYYSCSTFGSQTSAIGVASTESLRSPRWQNLGPVIQSDESDPYNAIDPAVFVDNDQRVWMVFGSFWKGIYILELDAFSGKRADATAPPKRLAWNSSIEAPFLYRHEDYYYLFVNFGRCCNGIDSTYEIRVGRSKDVTGPYLDRDGRDMKDGGGNLFLATEGRYIGPGHAGILYDQGVYWFSYHYYDGESDGRPTMGLQTVKWTVDGWPELETPSR